MRARLIGDEIEVRVDDVDPNGNATIVRVRSGERLHAARISFPREVTTAEECRSALIEMVRGARG